MPHVHQVPVCKHQHSRHSLATPASQLPRDHATWTTPRGPRPQTHRPAKSKMTDPRPSWLSFPGFRPQCWALQTTFNPTPGIPQEHDSTPRRLSSVYPRQATHVLFTKNGPVESECKLNNVNPHIIRNQYKIQNQRKVTLNEHRYCKWCHYHTNTEF